ncbi:hypothetical protein HPB51_020200 [Rhipicephalus microplus]|uniref:Uncharacterized protein n=1 Tax=Rhipicephalus microplus TaxID=6941 RepID=A0A9J6D6Y9_RHIMP|nr:hypothetical protein HPB51_020200 [Rhipicephalus microplus]
MHMLDCNYCKRAVHAILWALAKTVSFAWVMCRPLAYSTLADLVHHVRQHLPLNNLSSAVAVFSRNVHDESLPASIQTMSCKLLLNLVECYPHPIGSREWQRVYFDPCSVIFVSMSSMAWFLHCHHQSQL